MAEGEKEPVIGEIFTRDLFLLHERPPIERIGEKRISEFFQVSNGQIDGYAADFSRDTKIFRTRVLRFGCFRLGRYSDTLGKLCRSMPGYPSGREPTRMFHAKVEDPLRRRQAV